MIKYYEMIHFNSTAFMTNKDTSYPPGQFLFVCPVPDIYFPAYFICISTKSASDNCEYIEKN
ncbi:hypothetical protein M2470_002588 [Parabacteroides sp. PH5-46]|nr:hypothetical protein [Parabacteroides sp. PH5-46]MDH6377521.1 hypothetical protein [Parabacteroides sp. PH5-33]